MPQKKTIFLVIPSIILLTALIIIIFSNKYIKIGGGLTANDNFAENLSDTENLFYLSRHRNGDSKFYDQEWVVTTLNNKFEAISFDGSRKRVYDELDVNWFSVEKDDKTIVYANINNEVGIIRLDSDMNVITNNVVLKDSELMIDPSIIKIDETYYITVTFINGAVNNSDPEAENGEYTIKLYSSQDLENFQYLCDVAKDKRNLEDAVSFYINDRFFVFYEREEFDKSDSVLEVVESDDKGISWSEPIVLCDTPADNELGNVIYDNGCFEIYFSSDCLDRGKSYEGASVFVSYFDDSFNPIRKLQKISSYYAALLYDVLETDDGFLFLYTEKYITESNLVLAKLRKQ